MHQAYTAMQFKITTDLLEQIRDLIAQQDVSTLEKLLVDFHFADVAEIIDELSLEENWTVISCVSEMRAQAENVTRVHSIYVVDNNDKLKGRLSLKDLLTSAETTPIKDVCKPKVDYVTVNTSGEEVARRDGW